MTMAVDLGMKGFKVNIFDFPEYDKNLRAIQERGSVEAIGNLEGKVEPNVITTDMAEAIEGADAIFIATRAYGAERFIGEAAKHMEPGQIILNWSSYLAALRAYPNFKETAPQGTILGEGAILPYFVKPVEPGVMNVYGVKAHLWAAAMPGNRTPELMRVVSEFYPNCEAAESVLYTSLTNPNLQVHVAPALLNTGTWEKTGGDLEFYGTLMTPKVAAVMDAIDKERIAVGKALGIELLPAGRRCTRSTAASPATGPGGPASPWTSSQPRPPSARTSCTATFSSRPSETSWGYPRRPSIPWSASLSSSSGQSTGRKGSPLRSWG
jgi:opine dehydrogenase